MLDFIVENAVGVDTVPDLDILWRGFQSMEPPFRLTLHGFRLRKLALTTVQSVAA